MEIDFNRFVSSQRYCSTVPLEELELKVVISRALTVEEDHIETVMQTVIPWNAKLYSPTEQIDMWNKLRQRCRREGDGYSVFSQNDATRKRGNSGAPHGDPSVGSSFILSEHSHSGHPSRQNGGSLGKEKRFPCPSPQQLLEHLTQPSTWLFTHPSEEDYIDIKQEECPVLPPQGASLLAPVILRRHRQEHLPSNHFYLVWADGMTLAMTREKSSGNLVARPPTTGAVIPVARAPPTASSSLEASSMEDDHTRSLLSVNETEGEELVDLQWSGQELVFCTIVMEPDGAHFTAKPTLSEEHTLRVDASHIYRFRVDVQHRRAPLDGMVPTSTSTEEETKGGHITVVGGSSQSRTGMLIQEPRGNGPSVVLPSTLSAFASAVHDKLVPPASNPRSQEEELGAATSVMSPHPRGGLTASGPTPMPMSRELLKAVAHTIPRGTSFTHHQHQAAARESARRQAFAGGANSLMSAATTSTGLIGISSGGADGEGAKNVSWELSTQQQNRSSAPGNTLHGGANSHAGTGRAVRFGLTPTRTPVATARTHYYIFGVLERCVGVGESTLFARCELYRDRVSSEQSISRPSLREEEAPFRFGNAMRAGAHAAGGEAHAHDLSPAVVSHPFCSQLAHAGSVVELDYAVVEPEHVFNCPFEYHYDEEGQCPLHLSDENGSMETPLQGVPPSPLRMAVGLYTEGYDAVGIQSAVGYACVTIPILSPGTHQIRCPVWSIHKTGAETLRSALVGGAPSFVDLRQAGPFPQNAGLLSPSVYAERGMYWNAQTGSGIGVKQSLVSESLGYLYLTVNILVQKDNGA